MICFVKMCQTALLTLFIIVLPSSAFAAADDTVDKTICKLAVGYQDVDQIQADLLAAAKREVINELFGEMIVASTAVENFVVTSDQIRTSSIGFVRVEGNANFFNGKGFAEVCVTIHAYVTDEDRAKFNPEKLEKKYCDANDDMTTAQLIAYVKDEAVIQALVEYNPKLKGVDKDSLLQLVQKVTYLESGFITDTQTYCTRFEGYVVPVEILAFFELDSVSDDGLVAYYSFDDGTAKDNSGNGHDGIPYGNPILVKGVSGKAFEFDGLDDYIIIGADEDLNRYMSNFTVIAWIRLHSYSESYHGIIISNRSAYVGSAVDITGKLGSKPGTVGITVSGGDRANVTSSTSSLKIDMWYHIALTFNYMGNNTNLVKVYVNGELDNSGTNVDIPNPGGISSTIGYEPIVGTPTEYHFDGALDELRIYNRVLSETDIRSLYRRASK